MKRVKPPPYTEVSLGEYFRTLFDESDRGCILAISQHLHSLLEDLHIQFISSKVESPHKLIKELTAPMAPLSSASGCATLAFAYGLISVGEYEDLKIIRKLRNLAAHSFTPFSLSGSKQREMVYALQFKVRRFERLLQRQLMNEEQKTLKGDGEDPKELLIACSISLQSSILDRTNQLLA